MKLIRSRKDAETSVVPPEVVDWVTVSGLQVWSTKHVRTRQLSAPAGLDIRWIEAAGVRYAATVVFKDDTMGLDRLDGGSGRGRGDGAPADS